MTLPRALVPFLTFAQSLRAHGFPAAPDQTQAFIAATGLLGPGKIADLRRAAHATFGPPPEGRAAFDTLFDAVFLGRALAAPATGDPEDLPDAFDAGAPDLLLDPEGEDPAGAEATAAERLTARRFADDPDGFRAFARAVPGALPRRRARRLTPGKGHAPDPLRTFRALLRHDGEITRLPRRIRRTRQRPVLMLVDVSGSMKAGTDDALRLSHALVQAGEQVEVFTIGTRLTRVTRALKHRHRDRALALAAGLVADWDGGTRLGDALQVFLSVPRFAAFARGALVVVLSDGLERGGPEALVQAMARMRGLAWSVLWLSPLAADPAYRPETGAMRAILPMLDRLGNGATPQAVAGEILAFSKGIRAA